MTDWGRRPPAGETPKFQPGDRVVWLFNGKRYPATVERVDWYRRTKEPWNYGIKLDRNDLTKRMSHLLRFPPQSQLEADGAWQCGDGHMFRYEPPPAWPPWCARTDCHAGNFRWITRDEVTDRDWLPEEAS